MIRRQGVQLFCNPLQPLGILLCVHKQKTPFRGSLCYTFLCRPSTRVCRPASSARYRRGVFFAADLFYTLFHEPCQALCGGFSRPPFGYRPGPLPAAIVFPRLFASTLPAACLACVLGPTLGNPPSGHPRAPSQIRRQAKRRRITFSRDHFRHGIFYFFTSRVF